MAFKLILWKKELTFGSEFFNTDLMKINSVINSIWDEGQNVNIAGRFNAQNHARARTHAVNLLSNTNPFTTAVQLISTFITVSDLHKILITVSFYEFKSNSNASDVYVGNDRFDTCPNQWISSLEFSGFSLVTGMKSKDCASLCLYPNMCVCVCSVYVWVYICIKAYVFV
jgi:hypothetical protein